MFTRLSFFLLIFADFSSAGLVCDYDFKQICSVRNQKISATEKFEIIRSTSFTDLILSDMEFANFPTTIFTTYPNLTFLSVARNQLKFISFKHFANAGNLKKLYFMDGDLVRITNGTFRSCKSLEELQLTGQKISVIAPNAFQGLENLGKLALSNNSIETLHPAVFSMLPYLIILSINLNKLKTLNPNVFKLNPSLLALSLTSNQIEELPQDLFDANRNLKSLQLDQNSLKSTRSFGISYVDLTSNKLVVVKLDPGTNIIHLKDNFIETIDCADSNLTSYERVFASNNSLTNFKCLREMENVYDLDVSDNKFHRPNPEVFSKLLKMKDFRFYGQRFSKIAAKTFALMKNVNILRVDRFVDYRNLRQFYPELRMVGLSTKSWNCSYTTQVSKSLERQKIMMNYNNFRDRQNCNVK